MEKDPRKSLMAKLEAIENDRLQVEAELQKLAENEQATVGRLFTLHTLYEQAQQKITAGKNQFEQVREQCGDGSLSWGSTKFSGQQAINIVASTEARRKLEAEFSTWLATAEAEERAAFKAVADFVRENRSLLENLSMAHNDCSFTRGLPKSIAPYLPETKE